MSGYSQTESNLLYHEPCDECGSSDAKAVYDDGHAFCFSCEHFYPPSEGLGETKKEHESMPKDVSLILNGDISPIQSRGITATTCMKFGYMVAKHKGKHVQVAPYYNDKGEIIAQKVRGRDKEFYTLGNAKKMSLWGKQVCPPKGRRIVITEGEIDALSVSQAFKNKWEVVSLPTGASSAVGVLKRELEWLNGYEDIVLFFDNDRQGRKAAEEAAKVLPVGKVRLAFAPEGFKDPNDMLKVGKVQEICRCVWDAKEYRPDGIVGGDEVWGQVSQYLKTVSYKYEWEGLNKLLWGYRNYEIVTICAGTGIGKTQFTKEITKQLIDAGNKVGVIALEESVAKTAMDFLSLYENKRIHLLDGETDPKELQKSYNKHLKDKAIFYDHFGSLDGDNLINKIRYMVVSEGCKYIILDHLSIAISGLEAEEGERKLIDVLMTTLRKLTEELHFGLFLISHLSKPKGGGKGFEVGQQIGLNDLRGSASIGQLSDVVIGLERDQQDEKHAHLTTVRVLKCRFTGSTGIAMRLDFNPTTGRMVEVNNIETEGYGFDKTKEVTEDF